MNQRYGNKFREPDWFAKDEAGRLVRLDLEDAKKNTNYRDVKLKTKDSECVFYSLEPNESIPREAHAGGDQWIVVLEGQIKVVLDNGETFGYVFSPDGLTQNPTLTLYRGVTYRFEIDAPGNPLSFRTRKQRIARKTHSIRRRQRGINNAK